MKGADDCLQNEKKKKGKQEKETVTLRVNDIFYTPSGITMTPRPALGNLPFPLKAVGTCKEQLAGL